MANNGKMIKKLQHALNERGLKILYQTHQFYSEDQNRPVTSYVIKQAVWNEQKRRNVNVELFSTFSQIQAVLYLRDMWYEVNGWEVPTDNEVWNKIKEKKISG